MINVWSLQCSFVIDHENVRRACLANKSIRVHHDSIVYSGIVGLEFWQNIVDLSTERCGEHFAFRMCKDAIDFDMNDSPNCCYGFSGHT